MKMLRKLLIIDDDPRYASMLAVKISQKFPELLISSSEQEDFTGGYDIYILDNDFYGKKCGARLAEQVRARQPNALVIILSGTLELDLVKRLVNCHAAGVFDKSEATDILNMMDLIGYYLLKQATATTENSTPSFGNTIGGIHTLLAEWNARLSLERQ